MARDLMYYIFCSGGLYSFHSTLVNRFITYEKSCLQQSYLTKVFQEQRDGLVVLKPRPKKTNTNTSIAEKQSEQAKMEESHARIVLERNIAFNPPSMVPPSC